MHKEALDQERVFVIHDFLSPQECVDFVAFGEHQGFEDAGIAIGEESLVITEYRSNRRVMVDDAALATRLFERARPFLPDRVGEWAPIGLNDRFRYYRYDVGQSFLPHYDGSFRRSEGEASKLTFMVYLNEDLSGGTTDFWTDGGTVWLRVQSRLGMALVFEHRQLHEGTSPTRGRKYVLRTDVVCRKLPAALAR